MESRAGGGCGRDRHLGVGPQRAAPLAFRCLPSPEFLGRRLGQVLLPLPRHETPVWPEWLWAEHTLLRRRLRLRQCSILHVGLEPKRCYFFFGGGAFLGEVEGQEGADGR